MDVHDPSKSSFDIVQKDQLPGLYRLAMVSNDSCVLFSRYLFDL